MFCLAMFVISLITAGGCAFLLCEAITVERIIMFVVAICAVCCWFINWIISK